MATQRPLFHLPFPPPNNTDAPEPKNKTKKLDKHRAPSQTAPDRTKEKKWGRKITENLSVRNGKGGFTYIHIDVHTCRHTYESYRERRT